VSVIERELTDHGQNLDDRARSARAKAGAAASTPATTSAGASEATLILTPMMPSTMSERAQAVDDPRVASPQRYRSQVARSRGNLAPRPRAEHAHATVVPFARTAADQGAVIAVERMAARAYIDASA